MFSRMMIFSFSILFGSTVLAYPNVGDKVSWTGSINQADGTVVPVKITKEVIDYNKSTKKWSVKYEATMGKETSTQLLDVDNLYSKERYKEIISKCESQGGKIEVITTDPGIYETCKMTIVTPEGVVVEKWWGNIPFGVVSKNTRNEKPSKYEKPDLDSIIAGL
ncbi:hypothetical protein QJS83_14405 [Bdellovibrio sp. 22V]|uniref:hypothetical protein n=1 Tax=Bdellovibrio TaxID=958 RepID=UPI002542C162|nr:hypothetical protein [Bdellovibrio sp. 22V]WII71657.1 hypothetical protein QJS83_14405 [Bdellovibrio sp. 22V]